MANEIFISYRRSDQAKAELLHRLLKERGVDSWYDALLGAGEDWRTKTAQALVDAPVFVLLFSKNAAQSDDIIKELSAATFQKKTVIPVRIEDIHPEGAFLYELASRNWFDAFTNTDARLALLADQLAALVKGGSEAQAAAARLGAQAPVTGKTAKKDKPQRGLVTLGIVGIVAAAVVAIVWSGINSPDDGPAKVSGYRTAFFGFTATGDDPAIASAVTAATEEGFRLLDLTHLDAVSRAETAAPQTGAVLERAGELGARLAVTGEIRREGGVLKAAVRVMDVSSRTTLVQQSLEGPVAKPTQIAYRIGAAAANLPQCIINFVTANKETTTDASALTTIGKACTVDLNGSQNSLRDLFQKYPDNKLAAAQLAQSLVWNLSTLPETQRPAALAEADRTLARAEQLAPDAFDTAVARLSVAIAHDRPPGDWLPPLEQALLRAPSAYESVSFGEASGIAGQMLLEAGRIEDAARYFQVAMRSDPGMVGWEYYYAIARAALGQYGAKESLDRLVDQRVVGYTWEVALTAAIFLKATDPEIILAAVPADAVSAVPCYKDLIAALKKTDRLARLAGAKKADACLMSFDSPHVNIQAQSMLGNLDRAFEIVDRPDYTAFMWNYWSPLFMPSTKAMRADARFLPLMQKLGYVDYWKKTKTQPDVCSMPDERGIPLCQALGATGN